MGAEENWETGAATIDSDGGGLIRSSLSAEPVEEDRYRQLSSCQITAVQCPSASWLETIKGPLDNMETSCASKLTIPHYVSSPHAKPKPLGHQLEACDGTAKEFVIMQMSIAFLVLHIEQNIVDFGYHKHYVVQLWWPTSEITETTVQITFSVRKSQELFQLNFGVMSFLLLPGTADAEVTQPWVLRAADSLEEDQQEGRKSRSHFSYAPPPRI